MSTSAWIRARAGRNRPATAIVETATARLDSSVTGPQDQLEQEHAAEVEQAEPRRERAVDERAVDDHRDVVEAIAQDRHRDGGRHGQQSPRTGSKSASLTPRGPCARALATKHTTSSVPAPHTHLICWRSTPCERRKRSASDPTEMRAAAPHRAKKMSGGRGRPRRRTGCRRRDSSERAGRERERRDEARR